MSLRIAVPDVFRIEEGLLETDETVSVTDDEVVITEEVMVLSTKVNMLELSIESTIMIEIIQQTSCSFHLLLVFACCQ